MSAQPAPASDFGDALRTGLEALPSSHRFTPEQLEVLYALAYAHMQQHAPRLPQVLLPQRLDVLRHRGNVQRGNQRIQLCHPPQRDQHQRELVGIGPTLVPVQQVTHTPPCGKPGAPAQGIARHVEDDI